MDLTQRKKDEKDNKTPTTPSSRSSKPIDVVSTLRGVARPSSAHRSTANTGPSGGSAVQSNASVERSTRGEGTEWQNTALDSAHFQIAGARTTASAALSLTPRTPHPGPRRQPWSSPRKGMGSPPGDAVQSDQSRHEALGDLSPRLQGTNLCRSSSSVPSGSRFDRCASDNSPPGRNLKPRGSPPRGPSSGSPLSRSPITFGHYSPSGGLPTSKDSPAKKSQRFSYNSSVGELLDKEVDPKKRLRILEKELDLFLPYVAEDRGLFRREIAELREAIAEEKRMMEKNKEENKKEDEAREAKRMVERALSSSLL